MNLFYAIITGITTSVVFFILLASLCFPGFFVNCVRSLKRPLLLAGIIVWALMMRGAVTQINLATQAFGTLPATSMPNPTASTLGGIQSLAASAHNWIDSISTSGVPHISQPNYTDLAGVLPNPGAASLGGVDSKDCSTTAMSKINTDGTVTCLASIPAPTMNQAAPTGTINGSNTSYTLSPTPTAAADVNCFENGVQQQQGAGNDYTISGATITYLTAPPTGSKLNCLWY